MALKLTTDATDVPRYHQYATEIRHGDVPYRDFSFEYPPAALVPIAAPALLASGARSYRIAFELLMALCGCGTVVAGALVLVRLQARVLPATAAVAAGTIALGPIVLGHFDLWPVFLLSAALAALLWDRTSLAAVLLGVAIAAKIYPFVAVPLALVWIWRHSGARRAWTWLGIVAAAAFACFVPFLAVSPGGVWDSLTGQASRPLQLESTAAAALLAAHQLVSLQLGILFSHSSANLGGRSASVAATMTVIAEVAVLLFVWLDFARRPLDPQRLVRSVTAAVLAFVLLGKVFSPQYLLWLIPLVPLLEGLFAVGATVALAAAILLTRLYFPGRWHDLILFDALPSWLLVARDATLIGLLAALILVEARRSRPA
jgi:uncharacterized membrane protein